MALNNSIMFMQILRFFLNNSRTVFIFFKKGEINSVAMVRDFNLVGLD